MKTREMHSSTAAQQHSSTAKLNQA